MTKFTVDIPDALKERIEARVVAGGYAAPADYLRELVALDEGEEQAVLAALDQGEASGMSPLSPEEILAELLKSRLAA